MQWEGQEESTNVEDRRGDHAGIAVAGGGSILLAILALIFGGDFGGFNKDPGRPAQVESRSPEEEKLAHFTRVVLRETEVVWADLFRQMGKQYRMPHVELYTGVVESACGRASSAVGPFYCPADEKVYLDLSFFREMQQKLKAPGEFARAYVIAHEIGHHVQKQLGYSQRVDEARRYQNKAEVNRMSVRLELQADYLAGVWAYHAQQKFNFLEKGDLESALNAAFQIGDDRLQKQARGYVVPDSFTHGTSKQRMRWFREGFKTGDLNRARLLFELPNDEL